MSVTGLVHYWSARAVFMSSNAEEKTILQTINKLLELDAFKKLLVNEDSKITIFKSNVSRQE